MGGVSNLCCLRELSSSPFEGNWVLRRVDSAVSSRAQGLSFGRRRELRCVDQVYLRELGDSPLEDTGGVPLEVLGACCSVSSCVGSVSIAPRFRKVLNTARAASLAASYRMWSRMWNVAPLVVIHVFRVVKYCCFCLRVSKAFSKRKVESVLAFLVVEYQIFVRTVLLYVSVESVFQVKVFPFRQVLRGTQRCAFRHKID